jgi:hypothetical protein
MIVEKGLHNHDIPPSSRRLNGQVNKSGRTKRGNKKRSVRRSAPGLLEEESGSDEDDEEDARVRDGDRPPVLRCSVLVGGHRS